MWNWLKSKIIIVNFCYYFIGTETENLVDSLCWSDFIFVGWMYLYLRLLTDVWKIIDFPLSINFSPLEIEVMKLFSEFLVAAGLCYDVM